MSVKNQADTPRSPRVGLAGFAEYLSAGASGRIDCVRRQIQTYGGPYRPGAAFYKDFQDALIEGRRAGSDELTLQRCVSDQRVDARRSHYATLRRHWLSMSDWHLPLVATGRTTWTVPQLAVGIAPEFALQTLDERVLVIKLWLREPEPSTDAVRAMQRLLLQHLPKLCASGVAPAIIDVRRERVHVLDRRPFKKGFDEMLTSEAMSMGNLWLRLSQTA